MKKYLKTINDVLALENTDTKIYERGTNSYWKFVNGALCKFDKDKDGYTYHTYFTIENDSQFYIEVDEHDCVRQDAEDEPSEDWIGKLGFFWDTGDADDGFIDVLEEIVDGEYGTKYDGACYTHFRPITPEEVEKYTGYKVAEEN